MTQMKKGLLQAVAGCCRLLQGIAGVFEKIVVDGKRRLWGPPFGFGEGSSLGARPGGRGGAEEDMRGL